ncbi:hypothetical protein H6P81_005593 [Aristolochia fimbriata]|uniref:Epidermal patterning factor-like protein n=1 Tax=Aristolochia fimbriata TaxID=158543 RepID=A0AAV7EW23_ARIFI|nr:hypothetical protein H6P81_005593 [Aristolochia fimbriata]
MKICIRALVLLASVFLLSQALFTHAGRINRSHLHENTHRGRLLHRHHHHHHSHERRDLHLRTSTTTRPGEEAVVVTKPEQLSFQMRRRQGRPDTVQIAGSSLPDCSHACGSCSPCRLVMVSFVCASLEEAETCPMAYKCMCRSKSYPVP